MTAVAPSALGLRDHNQQRYAEQVVVPQNGAGEGFFYVMPISQCTAGLDAHVLTATYASGTFTGLFCVNGKGFGTYTQGNTDWVRLGHRREGHYRHWCLGQEPVIGGDNEGHQEFVRRVGSGIIQVRDVHIELGAEGSLDRATVSGA